MDCFVWNFDKCLKEAWQDPSQQVQQTVKRRDGLTVTLLNWNSPRSFYRRCARNPRSMSIESLKVSAKQDSGSGKVDNPCVKGRKKSSDKGERSNQGINNDLSIRRTNEASVIKGKFLLQLCCTASLLSNHTQSSLDQSKKMARHQRVVLSGFGNRPGFMVLLIISLILLQLHDISSNELNQPWSLRLLNSVA
ncbi:hypothetical protein PGT21_021409 [Puccinia graminis f. sp. tritici]|nr:hypothetical protein PGT21_021409 [Puccinia graminis f. sp. tritici]